MNELVAIEYGAGAVVMRGQLAIPEGDGPHPGILVMHDARGLGEHVRHRASRLAQAGYVAFATDMYGDGRYFDNPRECAPYIAALHADSGLLRSRALAALDVLRALPSVDACRTGAIGFCFGGQCVLEMARTGADIGSVVSFHGILTTQLPAQRGQVRAKILAMSGALDPYVPKNHVDAFQSELTAAGADWQMTVYGSGWHAFTDATATTMQDVPGVLYDPLLDRLSWAQAMAHLDTTVSSRQI